MHSQNLARAARLRRPWGIPVWPFLLFAGLALGLNPAHAQEDQADAEEDEEAIELQPVVVTGSRLNRPPSELSANLIVLDGDAIRASGELTLARVLRQLPQNINGTSETWGSTLNGATNVSGASTVNLRGLGSESTLILVDGRRVGYSGILGGVTDISTIPLSMVERVEVLLDGASAVYGSDAVGGVVNIITRKDYSGVEVDLNYGRPHKSGYDEIRAGVSTGWAWEGGRGILGYEFFNDSGLDGSNRDSVIFWNRDDQNNQKGGLAGPQMRAFSWFFDNSCNVARAVVWRLDGRVITRAEYAGLDPADQARAECHADVTLPAGFMPGDDLNGIEIFGPPNWGEDAEQGFSLRPEQRHHSFNLGLDQDLAGALKVHGNIRYTQKDTNSNSGLNSVNGTLHAGNPFNPFGRAVTVRGQILNAEPQYFDTKTKELFTRAGLQGRFGERWSYEAEFSRSQSKLKTQRLNAFNSTAVGLGLNTDGVSESVIARISGISMEECEQERAARGGTRIQYSTFFGGNCTIYGAPPDPINPFGDLSAYVVPGLNSRSNNKQLQFEALARGELFDLPGGAVALLFGYDYRNDVLDTMSEFHDTGGRCSGISCPNATPAGATAFNTRIGRDNHAGFFEGLVPLVGRSNARPGIQRLNLTFSGRYDSYSNVQVDYRESASGDAGTADVADPGSEFTWSLGLIYRASDAIQFKANAQTAFVAPQLNQLVARTRNRVPSAPFRGLFFTQPDSKGRTQTHNNVLNNTGGNDQLVPETSDSLSFGVELAPEFLPGLLLKATWSETESKDRITYFSSFFVDPQNLPTNVMYNEEEDIYIRDDRWINVAYLERAGMDYELRYEWQFGANDLSLITRHSRNNKFAVQPDAANPEVQSLVTTRNDRDNDLNPILSAIPKHQTNVQLIWERGGFSASVDVQGAARTSHIFSGGSSSDGSENITKPATVWDLVVGYDFGQDTLFDAPAWMGGLRATITVNNLTNKFPRNSRVNLDTGEVREWSINPVYEWTQGRSYRLTVQKSF